VSNWRTAVETILGTIEGRDGIHLARTVHELSPSTLILYGNINARLCTSYSGTGRWISYELRFSRVSAYKCWELDYYPWEACINSSFDVVKQSKWLEELSIENAQHFVLSTYDYIYEIVAEHFDLILGEGRP